LSSISNKRDHVAAFEISLLEAIPATWMHSAYDPEEE